MKNLKFAQKLALATILLICLIVPFLFWYNQTYPRDILHNLDRSLLIAKQSSPFKDSISSVVSYKYKFDSITVKIIDISALVNTEVSEFDAILIIYRWEAGAPPDIVETFINNNIALKNNIVLMTTSWDGLEKIKNVDAITGASVVENVPMISKKIIKKLDQMLKS